MLNLASSRVVAVVNLASGGSDTQSPDRIRAIFEEVGLANCDVVSVGPEALDAALSDAVAHADVVAVLGGDGTIRSAAAKCGTADKLLIPLPGGTMNMLPHALYGDRVWEAALKDTLADPIIQGVSGGRAGSELFFCAAVLGAPTLWADAREALRHLDVIEAAKRSATAIRRSHDKPLAYQFDDLAQGSAEAVAVICPLVSRGLADDEPCLEAAAIEPQTAAGLFRLAFHAVFEDWRQDPSVCLGKITRIRVVGHGRVPLILDGEKTRLGRIVNIKFVPQAFRALVPAATPACDVAT